MYELYRTILNTQSRRERRDVVIGALGVMLLGLLVTHMNDMSVVRSFRAQLGDPDVIAVYIEDGDEE